MNITCELCGLTYVEGLPEDEKLHSDRHLPYSESLRPNPLPELQEAIDRNPEVVWVDRSSPKWLREQVYWRARVFKREFGYDMPQWEPEGRHDPNAIGHLFIDSDCRIIGACCFRPEVEDLEEGTYSEQFRLDWLWLCPSARRRGILTRHWESFRARFGDFSIGGPVSEGMSAFLLRFPNHRIDRDYVQPPAVPMEQFCRSVLD